MNIVVVILSRNNKKPNDVFESQFLVWALRGDSNSFASSRESLKTLHIIDTRHIKKLPNSKEEIEQKYLEQIDLILDNLHEKHWKLRVSSFDITFFGYSCADDFKEEVLEPIISKIARKKKLGFEEACDIIKSRIELEAP